jgi:hypothetical protein
VLEVVDVDEALEDDVDVDEEPVAPPLPPVALPPEPWVIPPAPPCAPPPASPCPPVPALVDVEAAEVDVAACPPSLASESVSEEQAMSAPSAKRGTQDRTLPRRTRCIRAS